MNLELCIRWICDCWSECVDPEQSTSSTGTWQTNDISAYSSVLWWEQEDSIFVFLVGSGHIDWWVGAAAEWINDFLLDVIGQPNPNPVNRRNEAISNVHFLHIIFFGWLVHLNLNVCQLVQLFSSLQHIYTTSVSWLITALQIIFEVVSCVYYIWYFKIILPFCLDSCNDSP